MVERIRMIMTLGGLVPYTDRDADVMIKIPRGAVVEVDIDFSEQGRGMGCVIAQRAGLLP
jgi:hypothetical protein